MAKARNRLLENELRKLINEFFIETESIIAKKIIDNFDEETNNFKQVCPIEMLDKMENPITLKITAKHVS